MFAEISFAFSTVAGPLGSSLASLLQLAATGAAPQKISAAALAIDPSLAPLLNSFPRDQFWPTLAGVTDFSSGPNFLQGKQFAVEFNDARYPYARTFVSQFETWLRSLGCIDIVGSCHQVFSQPTRTNILDLSWEYRVGRVALFLGAGVSHALGLPLWDQLISRLVDRWISTHRPEPATAARLCGQTKTQQARWLKNQLGTEFLPAVQEALYREVYRAGVPNAPTLDVISHMTSLRAICTYNFDDLLERGAGSRFKPIASPRNGHASSEIPVYHVHGLLPFMGAPQGDVIFSETDYHAVMNSPLHWANLVQIHLLRECTCLLIGLSCEDPNLRRLLDFVGSEKFGETYIVMRMNELRDDSAAERKAWSATKEFDRDQFADLNLKTIWIHDHHEIPEILRSCLPP